MRKGIPNALTGKEGGTEEKTFSRLGCKTTFPDVTGLSFTLRNPIETSALSFPSPLLGNLAESSAVVK